jgi:hypothetical protein
MNIRDAVKIRLGFADGLMQAPLARAEAVG